MTILRLPALAESRAGDPVSRHFFSAANLRGTLETVNHSPKQRLQGVFAGILILCDGVLWVLSFSTANQILLFLGTHSVLPNLSVFLFPLLALGLALSAVGGYDHRTDMLSLEFTSLYLIAWAVATPLAFLLVYLFGTYDAMLQPSRALLPIALVLFAPLSLLHRRLLTAWSSPADAQAQTFLVVCSQEEGREFFDSFSRSSVAKVKCRLEFVDPHATEGRPLFDDLVEPTLHGNCAERLDSPNYRYDAIIIAGNVSEFPGELTMSLVETHFRRMAVYTAENFFEDFGRQTYLPRVTPDWLFQDKFLLARKSVFCYLKRGLDVVFALAGLLVALPLLLLLAAVIPWESRGSAIFRQQRMGRDGRLFTILKFRTMRQEETPGSIYTQKDDSRVTRLGAVLRKTRLDELPQLWNVVRGDMSLIGPRAEWIKCTEIYEREIPNYHLRHLVRPGVTGWAQINYPYGQSLEDAVEKLSYDLYYIRHFSLLLDWSIILKTIYVMLCSKGR